MPDRKFARWSWYHKENPRQTVEFEVRVKWGNNDAFDIDGITGQGYTPTFYVDLREQDMYFESGDLTHIAELVCDALNEFYAIEWKPMLMVFVNTDSGTDVDWDMSNVDSNLDHSCALRITTKEVQSSGQGYWRTRERYDRGWSYAEGETLEDTRFYKTIMPKAQTLLGIVDDTTEIRAGLATLKAQLGVLHSRLVEMLSGDKLHAALMASSGRLLGRRAAAARVDDVCIVCNKTFDDDGGNELYCSDECRLRDAETNT